jgi:hypothetical protein
MDAKDPKIFRVPNVSHGKAEGGLGYFGCAEFGGQRMAAWLKGFLGKWSDGTPDDFGRQLTDAVVYEQTAAQEERESWLPSGLSRMTHSSKYLVREQEATDDRPLVAAQPIRAVA